MATWINLFDIIYPVGSIYHSTSSTSPASTVGGTWSAISGRFLLGANSSYPAGKQDGAASVTLSLSQIPAHSHQWKGWNWLQTSANSGDKALVVGSDVAGSTASAGGVFPQQYAAILCGLYLEKNSLTSIFWMEVSDNGNNTR